jgi:hypothetical protein
LDLRIRERHNLKTVISKQAKKTKEKKCCNLCNRGLEDAEFATFDAFINGKIEELNSDAKLEEMSNQLELIRNKVIYLFLCTH